MKTESTDPFACIQTPRFATACLFLASACLPGVVSGDDSPQGSDQAANAVFEAGPAMPTARTGHQVAMLPDGRVGLFGGHGQGFVSLNSADFWTQGDAGFSSLTMNQTRDMPIFSRLADGRYLLAGGSSNLGVPAYAHSEIYDPGSNTFTPSSNMVRFRTSSGAATLADGRVLIAGGWWTHNDAHTYGELFDPETGSYSAVGPFEVGRSHAIVLPMDDGSGVVIGGRQPRGGFEDMPVERYNPATGEISVLQQLLFAEEPGWGVSLSNRHAAAQQMADGRYLWMATRAEDGLTHYRLFTFDPADGSIEALPLAEPLPDSSAGSLLQVLVDANQDRAYIPVLVAQSSGFSALEIITINTSTGVMVRSANSHPLGYSLMGAGMQVLPDGRIFVSGGSADGSNFNPAADTLLITPPEVDTTPWYSDAFDLGSGWLHFEWFKSFKPVGEHWIFHAEHGWQYVLGDDANSLFAWDEGLGRWLWISESEYPWMYAFGPDATWIWYFEDGVPGARVFSRGDNNEIVTEDQLRLVD